MSLSFFYFYFYLVIQSFEYAFPDLSMFELYDGVQIYIVA